MPELVRLEYPLLLRRHALPPKTFQSVIDFSHRDAKLKSNVARPGLTAIPNDLKDLSQLRRALHCLEQRIHFPPGLCLRFLRQYHLQRVRRLDAAKGSPSKQGQGLFDGEETARRLGVESWVISRWAAQGLLSPAVRYGYEAYFAREEIERFLADYVSSKEAAEVLGLGVRELEAGDWSWGLEAASGIGMDRRAVYLLHRGDVERVRSEFIASS